MVTPGIPPDRLFSAVVKVNGAENDEFYKCIESIRVDEDLGQGSSFQVKLSLCRKEDGSWPHAQDETLEAWNRVTIIVAFPERSDVLIDGYISHIHVSTNREQASMAVEFGGVDASYVMNLEQKCKVWTERTYEQIAEEIVAQYPGYTLMLPEAAQPAAEGGSPPPSVTQRATDHAFLRELARRKGYEFYMQGSRVFFRPADLSGSPQKLIATNFGESTNCDDLSITVDGTRPTAALLMRTDPLTGEDLRAEATTESTGLRPMGVRDLAAVRGYGVPPTRVILRRDEATSPAEMAQLVEGYMRRHGWWITARGTLNGLRYGRALRSRKTVTIMGFGTAYNGEYYVRKVIHMLGPRTYSMQFEAVRNRLERMGTEDFTPERPDQAPALGPSLGPGDFELPRDGNRVA